MRPEKAEPLMSQQAWHDKDPAQRSQGVLHPFTGNGDVSIHMNGMSLVMIAI
jgi:hypothetical protein